MFQFLIEYAFQLLIPSAFLAGHNIAQVPPVVTVGPQSSLYVTNEFIAPDGFRRSASLVNGVFPAPLISATKGDNFKLNVVNFLSDSTMLRSTSIHWHGILQRGTNWADGPVGVSQCPISPNRSFLYDFNTTEAGTFWYHSHYGTQYCDGIRGALVVYDPNDPHKMMYDVDDETTVITLSDWYHIQSPSAGSLPEASSVLINGKGRYPEDKTGPLSIVNVEFGKRYRLRIVSIACDPYFKFSIDNHDLTVIEADGESVMPVRGVHTLEIFAGQRYSVILTANQPVNNYWIRSLPLPPAENGLDTYDGGINCAILRYKDAKDLEPTTMVMDGKILRETELHPLVNPAAPGLPIPEGGDFNQHFELTYYDGSDPSKGPERFMLNGESFQPPKVPILLQILSGTPPEQLMPDKSIIRLKRNQTINISFNTGQKDTPHPFHLHGHAFSVIRSAGSTEYNYANPVRRDTVSLGDADSGSRVTFRFRTDNPGPWILHCHIDWHLELGMAVIFAEDTEGTKDVIRPSEEWHYLCPTFDNLPASLTSISTINTITIPTPPAV